MMSFGNLYFKLAPKLNRTTIVRGGIGSSITLGPGIGITISNNLINYDGIGGFQVTIPNVTVGSIALLNYLPFNTQILAIQNLVIYNGAVSFNLIKNGVTSILSGSADFSTDTFPKQFIPNPVPTLVKNTDNLKLQIISTTTTGPLEMFIATKRTSN